MPFDKFLIAPLNTGWQNNIKPWLIPDDAFDIMNNAYLFRGRLRKRFGSYLLGATQLNSRLRIDLPGGPGVGITDAGGNAVGIVPGTVFEVGQLFSIGGQIFTVNISGAPAVMLNTGAGVATFNTITGAYTFAGVTPLTQIFFYPAQPVMGFANYESISVNNEPTFAFDTQFAYVFTGTGWVRLGTAVWTGSDAAFFWTANWHGITPNVNLLFVSNYNVPDLIKYWNGAVWTNFSPVFNAAGDTIQTALNIIPFKDRLLLFNTFELIGGVSTQFINRVRFSQNGGPLQVDAWREDIPGKGGFLDASTQQGIISVGFIKDRLIVFFERNTYELVYTGNEILPFRFQQINTELGVESPFSVVPFDKVILGIGDVGVHACNGANVERIDEKIPDEVFQIHNGNDGVFRVHGIRDYYTELVYWTFPALDKDPIYPTRVLVYNYRTGSWALNTDSITVFGYFQNLTDLTWQQAFFTWEETLFTWNSAQTQSQFREIIAGNQEGFTFIIDADTTRNSPSLQITNITVVGDLVTLTVINHNIDNIFLDFVALENIQGLTNLNGRIYPINTLPDANTITILQAGVVGTYLGGGTVARVSNIEVFTKQYNFYASDGRNAYIQKVDFLVDKTARGQVTIEYFASSAPVAMLGAAFTTGAILGTGVLETSPFVLMPLETFQDRLWHPVYLQTDGECIQLEISMTDDQLTNPAIAWADFQLHAMLFYAQPTTQRLQ